MALVFYNLPALPARKLSLRRKDAARGFFFYPEAGVDVLSWGILFPAGNGKAGHWKFNVRL